MGIEIRSTSDHTLNRGALFTDFLWKPLVQLLGSRSSLFPTSYHPESNSIIERFHRTLKTSLASRMNQEYESCVDALPFVMFGLCSAIPTIPGETFSPMHYVLPSAPRIPLSLNERTGTPNDKTFFKSFNEMKHAPPRVIPEPPDNVRAVLEAHKKSNYVFLILLTRVIFV
uniref:Putative LOC101074616 [Takifugu rubripes] n=1 Tax=Lepeophtheirus salmonis TaxID=72036 RepID=A0A0K2TBW0_LEPSM